MLNSKGTSCPSLAFSTLKLMVLNFIIPQYCELSKEPCLFNTLFEGKEFYSKQPIRLKYMYKC